MACIIYLAVIVVVIVVVLVAGHRVILQVNFKVVQLLENAIRMVAVVVKCCGLIDINAWHQWSYHIINVNVLVVVGMVMMMMSVWRDVNNSRSSSYCHDCHHDSPILESWQRPTHQHALWPIPKSPCPSQVVGLNDVDVDTTMRKDKTTIVLTESSLSLEAYSNGLPVAIFFNTLSMALFNALLSLSLASVLMVINQLGV